MPDRDTDLEISALYFFPDRPVSETEARRMLLEGSAEERADVVSNLLRYAQWEDIWTYVSRDEVRDIFSSLDLPDSLRQAWARILKIEAVVS
jgi:hypothetical protein